MPLFCDHKNTAYKTMPRWAIWALQLIKISKKVFLIKEELLEESAERTDRISEEISPAYCTLRNEKAAGKIQRHLHCYLHCFRM